MAGKSANKTLEISGGKFYIQTSKKSQSQALLAKTCATTLSCLYV